MSWQSSHPWNRNKKIQSQRYKQKQQNWSSGSYYNVAQNGLYNVCYNAWQQNNAYCQPIPQNMHPISRPCTVYRPTFSGPRLPQYSNPSNLNGAHQYYQGTKLNF